MALTDGPANCFARDLILAYPEAKVVLNVRRDEEAWQRSLVKNLVGISEAWAFWGLQWFDKDMFWMWNVYEWYLWYGLFRCTSARLRMGIVFKGKKVCWEHGDMVRGMMRRLGREGELLEWEIGDVWEPLYGFLGKEVPRDGKGVVEGFPRTNDRKGFQEREKKVLGEQGRRAIRNLILVVLGVGRVVGGVCWRQRR